MLLLLAACLFASQISIAENHLSTNAAYQPLVAQGFEVLEFTLQVQDRKVNGVIASPPVNQLAEDPLLLLSIGGPTTHLLPPNDQPAKYFWKHGHRVVSFDYEGMPWDLNAFRDIILSGATPIDNFIADGQAVIQHCIAHKWATPEKIVISGISRFAYLGFRLMAADSRLQVGAGFAPVTDWRDLSEFHSAIERQEILDLRLTKIADKLAGKHLFLCIGSHDERVNTLRCCEFFLDLCEANKKQGFGTSLLDFLVTTDPGHTCGDDSFEKGMDIVMRAALKNESK